MKFLPAYCILFFLLSSHAFAQEVKTSAYTKHFLKNLNSIQAERGKVPDALPEDFTGKYLIEQTDNQHYVRGIMKVGPNFDKSSLSRDGWLIQSEIKDILTFKAPIHALQDIEQYEGIAFLEISTEVHPYLDHALVDTRADSVHAGHLLQRPYTGKDVILGITDVGYDYGHPIFFDTSGENLRITRAWNQREEDGTPPEGFNFGAEYIGQEALLAAQRDEEGSSHGVHVAGIAGGTDMQNGLRGVAPDGEFVLVTTERDIASRIDGFNYLVKYADEVQKALVINMSWGNFLGPADGTSLINQAMDELSGAGRIFVGSAGNNGADLFHIGHEFTESQTDTFKSVIAFRTIGRDYEWGQMVNLWGTENSEVACAIEILDRNNKDEVLQTTPFYASIDEPSVDTFLILGSDTVELLIESEARNPFNDKPNIMIRVRNTNTQAYHIGLKVIGQEGDGFHAWNIMEFTGRNSNTAANFLAVKEGYTQGDNTHAIGEPNAAKRSITVGSYMTRYIQNTFLRGDLSSFSSHGPTLDGRTKPEITAPGQEVASAISSYDDEGNFVFDPILKNERQYYFRRLSGTSMAAPHVSGVVAMMLERHKFMNPEEAKEILIQTARLDEHTGEITAEGSNSWGWGKVDALRAMVVAEDFETSRQDVTAKKAFEQNLKAYPNPSNGSFRLQLEESELQNHSTDGKLQIFNLNGQIVMEQNLARKALSGGVDLNLQHLANGVYIIQFQDERHLEHAKIMIAH